MPFRIKSADIYNQYSSIISGLKNKHNI